MNDIKPIIPILQCGNDCKMDTMMLTINFQNKNLDELNYLDSYIYICKCLHAKYHFSMGEIALGKV